MCVHPIEHLLELSEVNASEELSVCLVLSYERLYQIWRDLQCAGNPTLPVLSDTVGMGQPGGEGKAEGRPGAA